MQKLLVFESHPVQYRVPIWRTIERMFPGEIHVVYASDCSVRGHHDVDFGKAFSWDEPMLEGYRSTVLNCERGEPLANWGSLTGKGVDDVIAREKPDVVLLTGFNYRYDLVAYLAARRRGIPVWLRCETQDTAFTRSNRKKLLRAAFYRTLYVGIDQFFYIGELNRQHYLHHGVPASKLKAARYATVNRFDSLPSITKEAMRHEARQQAGISADQFVVGFSGKFIPKKNPVILFDMVAHLPPSLLARTALYFIGSGPLEATVREKAAEIEQRFNVKTHFAGFVNQTKLAAHYLALDTLVLPSKRMGETWGLVANEAMQAGCSVVVSSEVGCRADFGGWPRFRVFTSGKAPELADRLTELNLFERDFDWAAAKLAPYSIKANALSIGQNLGLIGERLPIL